MQVKNDLRNNDLESFKNIVNSTNDTHNKLISSIQKNVDQMIRDKSQQEGVTMAMEEKISKISVLRLGKNIFQATLLALHFIPMTQSLTWSVGRRIKLT